MSLRCSSLMNNAVLQWEPALAWEALIFQRSREQQEIGDDSSCPGPGAGHTALLLLLVWLVHGDFIWCLAAFMSRPEKLFNQINENYICFCLLTFIC